MRVAARWQLSVNPWRRSDQLFSKQNCAQWWSVPSQSNCSELEPNLLVPLSQSGIWANNKILHGRITYTWQFLNVNWYCSKACLFVKFLIENAFCDSVYLPPVPPVSGSSDSSVGNWAAAREKHLTDCFPGFSWFPLILRRQLLPWNDNTYYFKDQTFIFKLFIML